jgi:glycosyltransferase involved in cell wall biosynthesis
VQGETGFLFDAGDTDGLSQALARAYEARADLAGMGTRARAQVEAKHSWTARCRTIVAAAERLALQLT